MNSKLKDLSRLAVSCPTSGWGERGLKITALHWLYFDAAHPDKIMALIEALVVAQENLQLVADPWCLELNNELNRIIEKAFGNE